MSANPAGSRRASSASPLVLAMSALALLACGREEEARPDSAPVDAAVLRSPASTALSQQSVAALARGVIADTLEVPFRILPDERRTHQVIAPAAGRIEEVFLRSPDQAMRAGERLALLYSPELVTAQREFLLLDQARDAGLVRQAEERLLRMGLAPSHIRSLRATGKPLERIPIASPRNGYVLSPSPPAGAAGTAAEAPAGESGSGAGMGGMSGGGMGEDGNAPGGMTAGSEAGQAQGVLRAGTSVTRGTVLAQVNDLAQVTAVLTVPVGALSLLARGDSVHLSLPSAGVEGMATVDFLEARVADTSGNVEVRSYLPNPGFKLKLGSLGKAHLATRPETAWVLPRTSIHDLGERHIVWVRDSADTGVFHAQEVRMGRMGMRRVEVLDGLAPGSLVAENASLLVDPDVVLEPRPIRESASDASHAGHRDAPAHPDGHGAGHGDHAKAAATLVLTQAQVLLAGIRTVEATHALVTPDQIFRAVTRFDVRSREDIPARVEGRIDRVLTLRAGEKVSRGQTLAILQSETLLAAQEEFLVAREAAASLAHPDLVRAQADAARRRLHVLGMTGLQVSELEKKGKAFHSQPILSPWNGILMEVRAQPGQYVAAGTPLFTIGRADRVWVETWMLADETAQFPEGTEAQVRIEGIPGEELRGRLVHVRQGTTLSGSITLAHIGIANPGNRILPGMQAWVTFRQAGKHVLSVPPSALLRSSTSTMAWVQAGENAFAPRMVRTGVESAEAVEILAGISDGESVVVSGAYLLDSEWTLRQGAGKVHASH